MAWSDALQGIGAGLGGALDAYSWQQDTEQRNQELQLRRDALQAEINAMLQRVKNDQKAADAERTARKREQADAATAAAERNAFIASLPEHLQGPARAKAFGFSFDAEDFAAPESPEQRAAREADELKRLEAESFARAKGTRAGNPPARDTAPPEAPRERIVTVRRWNPDTQQEEVLYVPESEAVAMGPQPQAPRSTGAASDSIYSGAPGQTPVTPASGGGSNVFSRAVGAVKDWAAGARDEAAQGGFIPTTPATSAGRPPVTPAGGSAVSTGDSFGDPDTDAQVTRLIAQFEASQDPDERAVIQFRLRQLTGQ